MTFHNSAKKEEIGKTVLLGGDPLRAKYIAENFLEDAKQVTNIRNMLGYTGKYKGKTVTAMGSGMGGPSIGIYSYELFKDYDVDSIIRIGTCGGYKENIEPGDLILALTASTDSNYAHQYDLKGTFSPVVSPLLLTKSIKIADKEKIRYHMGMILTSDLFSSYNALGEDSWKKWSRMGALAQDMETYILYSNAHYLNKNALSILTMTDNLITDKCVKDRVKSLDNMIKLALEISNEF